MSSSLFSRCVLAVAALGASLGASAMVLTPVVNITKIHSYTDYGAGDVIFNVDATIIQSHVGPRQAAAQPISRIRRP